MRFFLGKSLCVQRRREELNKTMRNIHWNSSTIRFLEKDVDFNDVIKVLTQRSDNEEKKNLDPHFVHVDITPAVNFCFSYVTVFTIFWCLRPVFCNFAVPLFGYFENFHDIISNTQKETQQM